MTEMSAPISAIRYRAFISYSHRDGSWANWLHKALETYRVPKRLIGQSTAHGIIPKRLTPIFRDRDELPSAHDLNRKVAEALAQSDNLIVICSPHSATSRWVEEEVIAFKRLGRGGRIFCLIVDGEPGASALPDRATEECFTQALRYDIAADGQLSDTAAEPIAADARPGKDGKSNAKLKLVAGLLDVGFDQLRQREQQRRVRRLSAITALALLIMVITTSLAISAVIARRNAEAARLEAQRRQAQTEDLLGFMLGDLHNKLKGVGRLDLMESVADKALTLFAGNETGSLTDQELARQSQALVQIGQIRLDEAKLDAAMLAFAAAYQRSAALAERHAGSGNLLFDRGQAEYWIGYVHWQRRELELATSWLTRYRDTSLLLPKIDATNLDWQLEVTYGEHNLAVLALERGDLDAARSAFEAELVQQENIATQRPDDAEVALQVADTYSWLGTVAERSGDLIAAVAHFRTQLRQLEELRNKEPQNRRWQAKWANAAELLAGALRVTTDRDHAMEILAESAKVFESLTTFDAKNQDWVFSLASVHIRQAEGHDAGTDSSAALEAAQAALQRLLEAEESTTSNSAKLVHRWLSRSWRIRALETLRDADLSASATAAARAVDEAEKESRLGVSDDDSLADLANALLILGHVQRAQEPQQPPPAWQKAHIMLAQRAPNSRYWRVLDPWLRLCRLFGDDALAHATDKRLHASGYVPTEPW